MGIRKRVHKHLRNASYVLRHKWYVGTTCAAEGIPLRGVLHDMSKFSLSEWRPYADHFYGDNELPRHTAGYNVADDPKQDAAFDEAWLRHIHRNDHHWQFWLLQKDDGDRIALPMPHECRLEMVCDWRGAGMAQGKKGGWHETLAWYTANKDRMILHPHTRCWIERFLERKAND